MVTAYIGFGANLGDPIQQILDARRELLLRAEISNLVNSSFYLTSPIGYQNQSDFVNCVSAIDTSLSAHSLLATLQKIEDQLGRQRDPGNQNAARLIDLDILLFSDESINDETLIVPHPRLTERLFALEPLCEIAPALYLSESGSISDTLKRGYADGRFTEQAIYRLS